MKVANCPSCGKYMWNQKGSEAEQDQHIYYRICNNRECKVKTRIKLQWNPETKKSKLRC
jgi:hypothetical protein